MVYNIVSNSIIFVSQLQIMVSNTKSLAEEKNLFTLEQAAKYLGVSLCTFRQNYSNRLNDVKEKIGNRVYVPKSELTRFLKSHNTQN